MLSCNDIALVEFCVAPAQLTQNVMRNMKINKKWTQRGKPTQNSFIVRFNRTYRDEILDLYVFESLSQVRSMTADWTRKYNEERPHDALDDLTPIEFLHTMNQLENSNCART